MVNKKTKKTVPAVQKSSKTPVNTVRRNKIFAIAGLVALFICGVAVGMFTASDRPYVKPETLPSPHQEVKILSDKNCAAIEELLNEQLSRISEESLVYWEHTDRAELYVRLMKRGCPENSEKYKMLALREIEIARALNDDKFDSHEVVGVIDAYKKLNMQAEAQKVLDTFKRLADPAIDFIIQAERIINEQNH